MKSYTVLLEICKFKSKVFNSPAPIISKEKVEEALEGFSQRERIYHGWSLFQLYIHQSATGTSCRETVAWGIGSGIIPPWASPHTSAYCNSRKRLPEGPMKKIMTTVGRTIEQAADKRCRPFGRDVIVVDGTSVQLPDTEANQSEYPQPRGQKPGCGQPVMYLAALMGLGSGAILDVACGSGSGHERALFRKLWPSLNEGDIVMCDNGFCSYGEFAKLLERRVDLVMCQKYNALKNKETTEIGRGDYIVIWERGKQELKWTDRDELPECLIVRAIEFTAKRNDGMEVPMIIFTTLLDHKRYPRKLLIELYTKRWEIEVSFDDIKTEMGMSLLKCKTPERCRCELWMGLIAYNIIRGVMLDAARKAGLPARCISFKGTVQRIKTYFNHSLFNGDPERTYELLLEHLARDKVVKRPGRWEPRKLKRRPKNYGYLSEPRKSFIHDTLSA